MGLGFAHRPDVVASLPGLYAAGAATISPPNPLPGCSISGWYAGQNVAQFSLSATAIMYWD